MKELFILILFACLIPIKQQKDVTGKWVVENVDVSSMTNNGMSQQQKEAMNNLFIKPLSSATFEFKANHHFTMTPAFMTMPTNNS